MTVSHSGRFYYTSNLLDVTEKQCSTRGKVHVCLPCFRICSLRWFPQRPGQCLLKLVWSREHISFCTQKQNANSDFVNDIKRIFFYKIIQTIIKKIIRNTNWFKYEHWFDPHQLFSASFCWIFISECMSYRQISPFISNINRLDCLLSFQKSTS